VTVRSRQDAWTLARADRREVLRRAGAIADGFRNYLTGKYAVSAEELLIDRTAADSDRARLTVLVGGLRVLGANVGGAKHGVFTKKRRP